MKNRDIYIIRGILEKWSRYKNINISYIVYKNIKIADTLIETFNKLIYNNDIYQLKKKKICEKYSSEIKDNKYIINEDNKKKFNDEMDLLDFNYLKSNELLNKELKIKFYKIKKEHLPKDISANELNEISFMI